MRAVRLPAGTTLLLAALPLAGCETSATPEFPQPDFRVSAGEPFALRAGDLGLVIGADSYLYLSIQSLGADSRCPPATSCGEPGFLDLNLELETAETQGAIRLQVPPSGEAVGTYRSFEIRVLEARPPGSPTRILPTEYALLMSVAER